MEAPLGGCKQRTILAALLLADGWVVSDSDLGGVLWERRPPTTYQAQIYTYASRLRGHFHGVRRSRAAAVVTASREGMPASTWTSSTGWPKRARRWRVREGPPTRRPGSGRHSTCGAVPPSPG
ncbi:hypothetical protein ACFQ3Z_29695 [Streptomyces nogalater]